VQNKAFSTNKILNLNGRLINLDTPRVMGILNLTPDSFYDGGRLTSTQKILERVEQMVKDGVDIIDVGGYSTRPGAKEVSLKEEADRVVNGISSIVKHFPDVPVSVDTFRSEIARKAIQEGASMINDISGGELDEEMAAMVARLNVPYVLMHMRGNPETMGTLTNYENPVNDLLTYFHQKIHRLTQLGVKDIIVDPGFGFAKTREQNFLLLNSLDDFRIAGKPIMVGLSRKSMVWKTLAATPEEALNGTTALHAIALYKGADILRVHDVKEAVEVIKLLSELTRASISVTSSKK
jgi:dihydropteroate synthase